MAKYPRVCYKHCDIQRDYKKLDYHFDWLDCPYHCEYGDEKLADYDASGCETIAEWKKTDVYKQKWGEIDG